MTWHLQYSILVYIIQLYFCCNSYCLAWFNYYKWSMIVCPLNILWFIKLQKLNKELLHYRKEYISACEKLCAYRNVSKLVDVS